MNQTSYEKGIDRGMFLLLRAMLNRRFGPLSPHVEAQIANLSAERAIELSELLLEAQSLQELGLDTTP